MEKFNELLESVLSEGKNLYKNIKDIDKDYKLVADDYTPEEYVDEALENSDVTSNDEMLLKKWLSLQK